MLPAAIMLKKLSIAIIFGMMAASPVLGQNGTRPLIIANGGEPLSLDPTLAQTNAETNIATALFEGLMRYDPRTGLGIPGLAESYAVSGGKLIYTFKLRDARWSDGTRITARTVVDS